MSRLSLQARRDFVEKVDDVLSGFIRLTLPVPVDFMQEVYRPALGDHGWAAMMYLKKHHPETLQGSSEYQVSFLDNDRMMSPYLTVPFPEGIALPKMRIPINKIAEHTATKILSWVKKRMYLQQLVQFATGRADAMVGRAGGAYFLHDLMGGCNTPGQVVEMWPEVQPFIPDQWQDRIRNRSAKSAKPTAIPWRTNWATENDFVTQDEWFLTAPHVPPQVRKMHDEVNDILTRMSILGTPERDFKYPGMAYMPHSFDALVAHKDFLL